MKPTTPPIIALAVLFMLGNAGVALGAWTGGPNPPTFFMLFYVGVAWAFSWWVLADSRLRGLPTSIDHGWFVFIAWPVMVPYHVLKTRRLKGCALLAGLIGLYLASYAMALLLFAVLSAR